MRVTPEKFQKEVDKRMEQYKNGLISKQEFLCTLHNDLSEMINEEVMIASSTLTSYGYTVVEPNPEGGKQEYSTRRKRPGKSGDDKKEEVKE